MIFTREKEVGNPFAVLLEKRWPVSQQFNGENGVAKCRKQFCLVADNGFLDFDLSSKCEGSSVIMCWTTLEISCKGSHAGISYKDKWSRISSSEQ